MEPVEELKVTPVIDNKPVPRGELVGDALSVISLKTPSDDSDPDRVVKRNSYRNLHRPNISHLDWVSQSSSKEQVRRYSLPCYLQIYRLSWPAASSPPPLPSPV